jgi:hypothetical protein
MSDFVAQSQLLLDLSGILLTSAKAGQWEEVEGLERQRQEVMEALFSDDERNDHENAILLADVIRQVQEIDEMSMFLVRSERDIIAQQLCTLRNCRQGVHAYQELIDD